MIEFTKVYEHHKCGFYRGWLVVHIPNAMYAAFQPDDDFNNDEVISDLERLFGYYRPEFQSANLKGIIDCVDEWLDDPYGDQAEYADGLLLDPTYPDEDEEDCDEMFDPFFDDDF